MKYTFWLVGVWGAVDPSLRGPFSSPEERLEEAKAWMKELDSDNLDNVFRLDIDGNGIPSISCFIDGELSEDSKEDDSAHSSS